MLCTVCRQDKHPVIEPNPESGRFFYVCANSECHQVIGEVQRSAPGTPATVAPLGAAPVREHVSVVAVPVTTTDTLLSQLRTRLAAVETDIALLADRKRERAMLRRMLRAAEGRAERTAVIIPMKGYAGEVTR